MSSSNYSDRSFESYSFLYNTQSIIIGTAALFFIIIIFYGFGVKCKESKCKLIRGLANFFVKLYESRAEIIHEMFYEQRLYLYYCFLLFLSNCSWKQYNLEKHGVYYFVADTILAFLFVLFDIYFIRTWLYHFRCTDVTDVRINIQQNYFEKIEEPAV